jgi:protease II
MLSWQIPDAIFDYDMADGTLTRVKQTEVPGLSLTPLYPCSAHSQSSESPSQKQTTQFCKVDGYTCTRLNATSSDGTAVPVTITHATDLPLDGQNPALLIGYGAYGEPQKTAWSSHNLNLLDRGWVLATAHVRGGGELGKRWHEGGRKESKGASFEDFVACAEMLVREGYADGGRLAALGASAGGLLLGAVANMRPELFRAMVLKVGTCYLLLLLAEERWSFVFLTIQ